MIKLEEDLKFYNSYFNGIQQICEHKSAKEVAEGALKVASYATLLMPLIVQVMCVITQLRIDSLAKLKERVVSHLNEPSNIPPTQKNYIEFLEASVEDRENEHFESVFERLTPSSQKSFFAAMAQKGQLLEAIEATPKTISEITIHFGDLKYLRKAEDCEMSFIPKVTKALSEFKNLRTITFDISDVAFYTDETKNLISYTLEMHQFFGMISGGSSGCTAYARTPEGDIIKYNWDIVEATVEGSIQYLKVTESLNQISIIFNNHAILIKKEFNKNALFRTKINGMSIYQLFVNRPIAV